MSRYSFKAIKGSSLSSLDGELGSVRDLLFEDAGWKIQYLIVDLGDWLPGRKILLPPTAVGNPDSKSGTLPVALTREQIRNSPDLDTDKPFSQRMQEELFAYYGWPGMPTYHYSPVGAYAPPHVTEATEPAPSEESSEGPQLRSCREITGYAIVTLDGEAGNVEDLIVDTDDAWKISLVAVDTGNWHLGRKIMLPPGSVSEVRWSDKSLSVDLTRDQVQGSPEYHPQTPVDIEFEKRVLDYYGRRG